MDEVFMARERRTRIAGVFALMSLLLAALGIAADARAQDSAGKFGTRYACVAVSVGAAWSETAISDLKDQTSGSAATGSTWSSVWLKNTHATQDLYLCLNAAASCGATTHMQKVPAGGALEVGTIGVVTSTGSPFSKVSTQGSGAATTGLLCGHVR